ncbi:alginate export family protein [Pedobacter fastidiosus]|uniref:Alginate export family protein n=1 Tax=Pedobacter fastidiosus TaxID=2765361 RepID=A0ABR7KSS7_9SPHI|nr:alginate export family protein [Pedobacter fastidiosus]MBC6110900.1 alginate export family protein [Pedobacter fastidiosus]
MKTIIILCFMLAAHLAMAQESPFKQLRYDENYSYLARDTSTNWYNKVKFSPLSTDKSIYFSFGGEVRYQYFYFKNQDWGEAPEDNDGFILSRYLGHVDFHAGRHFRTFVQLQSSLADGQAETPSPVDQNPLDLHQAFIEYSTPLNDKAHITLRVGRQELSYGSQRLVAVREAPNNRQSFDAAKIVYANKNTRLDFFYAHYVPAKSNIFDDGFSDATQFWGVYGVFNEVPLIKNIDLYYLGIHKKVAIYNDGKGAETRHSIGARVWANTPTWQYDLEGLYQFGDLEQSNISAWTMSANVSYTFFRSKLKPQIGLKTEAISGDKNTADNRLNTFNPLFPKGAYFGLAALIGPYNLMDIHPYVQLNLTKKLLIAVDYDMFWRMNRNDGLYAVNGKLIYPSMVGSSKHIGKQLGGALEYSPNIHLSFKQEITWFSARDYLKTAGPGKDILMTGSTITLKF